MEHKIKFMKKVMENDGYDIDESLTTTQKQSKLRETNIFIENTRRCEKA